MMGVHDSLSSSFSLSRGRVVSELLGSVREMTLLGSKPEIDQYYAWKKFDFVFFHTSEIALNKVLSYLIFYQKLAGMAPLRWAYETQIQVYQKSISDFFPNTLISLFNSFSPL